MKDVGPERARCSVHLRFRFTGKDSAARIKALIDGGLARLIASKIASDKSAPDVGNVNRTKQAHEVGSKQN